MRIVADTNIVLSGLLWPGAPRRVLEFAASGQVILYTSPKLLAELARVLNYPRFSERLQAHQLRPDDLVAEFSRVAVVIEPPAIAPVILADPDDDAVLACAMAAAAEAIVTGDDHLLALGTHAGIPIIRARGLLEIIEAPER